MSATLRKEPPGAEAAAHGESESVQRSKPDDAHNSRLPEVNQLLEQWPPAIEPLALPQHTDDSDTPRSSTLVEGSEDAIAHDFAARWANSWRYVDGWKRWRRYERGKWSPDAKLEVFNLARKECRRAAAKERYEDRRQKLASAQTVSAVERLSRSDVRLVATVEQWDANPWALNTANGVIDLKTGTISPHDPKHFLTKMTAAGYGGNCPKWLAFLDRITAGDRELQAFLQRAAGYTLTGSTQEHALFFYVGTGANGKSVFLNTIAYILGDYARVAAIETFTDSRNDRHPTELAMLQGARMVLATEAEEGRDWAESKIKLLTGGDKVAARFMRQDFFEYLPQFKIHIGANHKPGLRSVGTAMRRRLNIIPFDVTIPEEERDGALPDTLRGEGPGILAWMVDGCLQWQRAGLNPPKVVREATETYFEGEDRLGEWIEAACDVDKQMWSSTRELYEKFKDYLEEAGEPTISEKLFSQRLEQRGFMRHKQRDGRGFYGLKLKRRAWQGNVLIRGKKVASAA